MPQRSNSSPIEVTKSGIVELAKLDTKQANSFLFVPGKLTQQKMANEIGILGITRLRLSGVIESGPQFDWQLTGQLGATISQECVVSLKSVRNRIAARVVRNYVSDQQRLRAGRDGEIPRDDSIEALTPTINLYEIARETMVLEMPTYPRTKSLTFNGSAENEGEPLQKPFAVLEKLKKNLEDG